MTPREEDSPMARETRDRRRVRTRRLLLAGLAVLALGCASDQRIADDWMAKASAREASAPLGGEALAQRKLDLDRCYRDVGHFLATIDAVHRRHDRNGVIMLGEFIDFYIGKHVIPMLEPEWQSRHPEVALLDANARLAVSALWAKLGAGSSAERMLDEIDRRFKGRGEMLVGYPIGGESTLRDAVALLRKRV
jgi:hypothetical protein